MAKFLQVQNELADRFLALAAATGKPRGLSWQKLEFVNCWILIRDAQVADSSNSIRSKSSRTTESKAAEHFTLIHSVNLSFEAIEGSDMEDVAAVSTIRDGSAIFHYQNGRWGTGGRVFMNLAPETAMPAAFPDAQVMAKSESLNTI